MPTGQGKANLAAHLEQAAKTKGITVAELKRQHGVEVEKEAQLPLALTHIWHVWQDIALGRGSNGMGLEGMSSQEIESWCRQSGTELDPWGFNAVRQIDAVFRKVITEKSGIRSSTTPA